MKRLTVLVILAVLLAGLILAGLSDTHTATAGTNVCYVETYLEPHEASNSSPSATITLTMTGVLNE